MEYSKWKSQPVVNPKVLKNKNVPRSFYIANDPDKNKLLEKAHK